MIVILSREDFVVEGDEKRDQTNRCVLIFFGKFELFFISC